MGSSTVARLWNERHKFGWLCLVALGLTLLSSLLSWSLRSPSYRVDIGAYGDQQLVRGFFAAEIDGVGDRYRWSSTESEIRLPSPWVRGPAIVKLHLGGKPPGATTSRTLDLVEDDVPWASIPIAEGQRINYLLLPPGSLENGRLGLTMRSETNAVPPDTREVGVWVKAVGLSWRANDAWLAAGPVLLAHWGLFVLAGLFGRAVQAPRWALVSGGLGLVGVVGLKL